MEKPPEPYPGSKRAWRLGFVILTIIILCLIISQIVLFELTRQAFLLSNWWFGVHMQFFSLIFTLVITMLVGPWFSMIVIFGSTHPKYGAQYWQWLGQGVLVMMFVGTCWTQLILLYNHVAWPYPPGPFVLFELVATSILYGVWGFTVVGISVVFWWKWLKPLS
jgi:hypothetical protein